MEKKQEIDWEESTEMAKKLGLTHFSEWIWKDKDGKRWKYKVSEKKFVRLDVISTPKNKIPKNW